MDAPRDQTVLLTGAQPVGGWVVHKRRRVREVQVLVNGVLLVSVTDFHERPDITGRFPHAELPGWTAELDLSDLFSDRAKIMAWAVLDPREPGDHVVRRRLATAICTVEAADAFTGAGRPDGTARLPEGHQRVYGVADVPGGISHIDITLDGEPVGRARPGLPGHIRNDAARPESAIAVFETVVELAGSAGLVRLGATAHPFTGAPLELDEVEIEVEHLERKWPKQERLDRVRSRFDARVERTRRTAEPLEAGAVRALVVTHDLGLGGGKLYLQELLRRLHRRGVQAAVVTLRGGRVRRGARGARLPGAGHRRHRGRRPRPLRGAGAGDRDVRRRALLQRGAGQHHPGVRRHRRGPADRAAHHRGRSTRASRSASSGWRPTAPAPSTRTSRSRPSAHCARATGWCSRPTPPGRCTTRCSPRGQRRGAVRRRHRRDRGVPPHHDRAELRRGSGSPTRPWCSCAWAPSSRARRRSPWRRPSSARPSWPSATSRWSLVGARSGQPLRRGPGDAGVRQRGAPGARGAGAARHLPVVPRGRRVRVRLRRGVPAPLHPRGDGLRPADHLHPGVRRAGADRRRRDRLPVPHPRRRGAARDARAHRYDGPRQLRAMGRAAHEHVLRRHDPSIYEDYFVAELTRLAGGPRPAS